MTSSISNSTVITMLIMLSACTQGMMGKENSTRINEAELKISVQETADSIKTKKSQHDKQARECREKLAYISEDQRMEDYDSVEKYKGSYPDLKWNMETKTELLVLALKSLFEFGAQNLEDWKYGRDNGKIPVNVVVGPGIEKHYGFMFGDGEVDTTVALRKEGKLKKVAIRTWTGTLSGVDKKIVKGEGRALLDIALTAWGDWGGKEVVVLSLDTNMGASLSFQNELNDWAWIPWWSPADLPVYAIIMWRDQGSRDWKTTFRIKKAYQMELTEICQALQEEWEITSE